MLRRVAASGRSVLTEQESKRFVTTYGFPVIQQIMADDVDEALAAAHEDRLPGRTQDRVAQHHAQERGRGRRSRSLLARRPGSGLRADAQARQEELPQGGDRGCLGPEDGPRGRLRADPRHEEGPAVRLGDRVRRRWGRRRGPRGLLGEPAAAQPDARAPHDGGDAHLQDASSSRDAASSRPTSASSKSC